MEKYPFNQVCLYFLIIFKTRQGGTHLDGDCTDVATVGMAVAVSILVALVTACVKVGPPRAELAAWETQIKL